MQMSVPTNGVTWIKGHFDRGNSIVLLIVMYIIAAVILIILAKIKGTPAHQCVFELAHKPESYTLWSPYLDMGRGDDYFLPELTGDDTATARERYREKSRRCPITVWSLLHFITYAVLGFLAPKLFWLMFVMGVVWEMSEWFLKCHCLMDIAWNFAGLVVGVNIRQAISPTQNKKPSTTFR